MGRFLMVALGLLGTLGCVREQPERTARVEVFSSPDHLLMIVTVGYSDSVTFEGDTPISRDVRARAFCGQGDGRDPASPTRRAFCAEAAAARVKSADPAGKRVMICLTDAGKRECETGNDGEASVTMTVDLR